MSKEINGKPWLGCIADDYTGASDLASFLVASGMRTLQFNGVPSLGVLRDYHGFDAVVVAIKSRTAPVDEAVADSLASLKTLRDLGCRKFFFKYCSTFDSTAQGNIGPVIDALLDELDQQSTVLCPALPVNGRTVYKGHLFVFDQLLSDSSLKDHPLTPMRDASIVRLIEAQGRGRAVNIPFETVEKGETALIEALHAHAGSYRYLVVDATKNEHLMTLGHSLERFHLVTGGSGLAIDLCAEFERQGFVRKPIEGLFKALPGAAVVLSGSCSAMTQKQVEIYQQHHPSLNVDPFLLNAKTQSIESIVDWVLSHAGQSPLVYTTADTAFIERVHKEIGQHAAQTLLEHTLASVAERCVEQGVQNVIVAGGETSGAVVKALGITAFQIGPSIAPGVPMMQTVAGKPINLALKSGNFGSDDFFERAVEMLTCS